MSQTKTPPGEALGGCLPLLTLQDLNADQQSLYEYL